MIARVARSAIVACVAASFGCVMTFEEARLAGLSSRPLGVTVPSGSSSVPLVVRDRVRCASLSDQARSWNARTKTFTGLAGAQGIGLIPGIVPDAAERWKGILAGGSAFFGALAFFSNVQAESYSASWAKECG